LFRDLCFGWWGADEYGQHRATAEQALLEAEHCRLKGEVLNHLKEGQIEAADLLYQDRCKDWWNLVDYGQRRLRASASHEIVRRYASSSIRDSHKSLLDENLRLSPANIANLGRAKLDVRLARYALGLDSEQRLACARPDRRLLINARAGSGKTRTLAAIAALAIDDEQLDPDQVLVLAFNTKAAGEIGDRVRNTVGADAYLNARTFHSLAYRIVGAKRKALIFDDGKGGPSRRKQSQFVERTLRRILNPAFKENIYTFFRKELEQIDRTGADLPEAEYFAFRRSMELVALNGDRVKSNGEKFIADLLFEHGIQYKYERVFSWDRKDHVNGSPYHPDFSISAGGRDLIIEHWAIDPDDASAEVPEWWDIGTEGYRRQIIEKREYWSRRGIRLIETHAGLLRLGREAFEARLHSILEQAGVPCVKLGHAGLVKAVVDNPDNISRMAELFLSFIQRAKKRGWTVEETARRLAEKSDPEPRNRLFHQLALRAYGEYERLLVEEDAMDYDDLMAMAAAEVSARGDAATIDLSRDKVIAIRELRWLLLDEFQDFSELYFRLIDAILKANPDIRLVAVGDDWQAINSFAGAQLKFFENFSEYFPDAGRVGISTNYRSADVIVGAGNRIMAGRGTPAIASQPRFDATTIEVRAIDKCFIEFRSAPEHAQSRKGDAPYFVGTPFASGQPQDKGPSIAYQQTARTLKICAEFIVNSAWRDTNGKLFLSRILVLARTGYAYGLELYKFERNLRWVLERHPVLEGLANEIELDVMTVHKAKGKEADTVIVLDVTERQFPKVHADNVLFHPFGVSVEDTLSEERRLFYVATTRAEHRLLLLTATGQESLFIKELQLERGLGELEQLAKGRNDSVKPSLMSEIGEEVRSRIEAIDPWDIAIGNASPTAIPALIALRAQSFPSPRIEYPLRGEDKTLIAEAAWPTMRPPVAILVGSQRDRAVEWNRAGWRVLP
jgi:DNA helicase-4